MKALLLLIIWFTATTFYGQVKSNNAPRRIQKTIAKKWFIALNTDSVKNGDTIVFSKEKKFTNFKFKRNHTIQEEVFYMYCGNKSFIDRLMPNPPKWDNAGTWSLYYNKGVLFLDVTINNQFINLLQVKYNKQKIIFVVQHTTKLY